MNATKAAGMSRPGGVETNLHSLALAARDCTRCDLFRNATQTVFGQGPANARIVMVGEQPGDREDIEGAPFVGPAGRILDEALGAAEIERTAVYLTNAVKHFRWVPRETAWAPNTLVTAHPSSILRERESAARHAAFAEFVRELTMVRARLGAEAGG